jgi:hypothetical protein
MKKNMTNKAKWDKSERLYMNPVTIVFGLMDS